VSTSRTLAASTVTDRDIATSLLTAAKGSCEKLSAATLEAASPNLYRLFHASYGKEVDSQRKIYEYMHRKNWYDPFMTPRDMASADLAEARKTFA